MSFQVGDYITWEEPFNNGPESGVIDRISRTGRELYCTTTDPRWPVRHDYVVYLEVNDPKPVERTACSYDA